MHSVRLCAWSGPLKCSRSLLKAILTQSEGSPPIHHGKAVYRGCACCDKWGCCWGSLTHLHVTGVCVKAGKLLQNAVQCSTYALVCSQVLVLQ